MEQQIKLRDLRIKEKFQLDDKYLNGYAKLCGWQGTLVYISICRHANKDQYSFPSIKKMAEEHGVGRNTIIKGIKYLEDWNLIFIRERERTKQGTWRCNGYDLLDKSMWKREPSPHEGHGTKSLIQTSPSPRGKPHQVLVEDTKDTHIKDTHIKDIEKNTKILDKLRESLVQRKRISPRIRTEAQEEVKRSFLPL